jgi:hypothetical protein
MAFWRIWHVAAHAQRGLFVFQSRLLFFVTIGVVSAFHLLSVGFSHGITAGYVWTLSAAE